MSHEPPAWDGLPTFTEPDHYSAPAAWAAVKADVPPLVPPAVKSTLLGEPAPPSTHGDDIDRIPVIYIAGPYSGADSWEVEKRVRRAEEAAYELEALGASTVCPHTNTRFQDHRTPYEQKIKTTLAAMRRCDAVYFLPDWHTSSGARGEHRDATSRGMVMLYSLREAEGFIRARIARRP